MSPKLVVVFDTNVLIPLALPSGRSQSTRLLSRLRAAGHLVAVSPAILREVAEKMRTKRSLREWLALSDEEIEQFIGDLPAIVGTERLSGNVTTPGAVKADPKDDKILAAAKESGASYIVSEDRHLRKLKEWEGIRIMNRDEFMTELDRLGVPEIPRRKPRKRRRKRR